MPRKVVLLAALGAAIAAAAVPSGSTAAESKAASVIGRSADGGLVEFGWRTRTGSVDTVAVEWSCRVEGRKVFFVARKGRSSGRIGKVGRRGAIALTFTGRYEERDADDAEPTETAKITLRGKVRSGATDANGRQALSARGTLRVKSPACDVASRNWSGKGQALP